ncbi:MAG: hypothetical protein ACW986_12705 [Promethearchaeota archaeon]|jgi:hypothetical protein
MVQIVIVSRWPLSKAQEIGTRGAEVRQEKGQSSAITSIKAYHTSTLNGWQMTAYHEVVDMEKIGEALLFLTEFCNAHSNIEGYSYEMSLAVSAEELAAGLANQQG